MKSLEEDFREKSARRFSEEMKGIKRDVQAVAEAQKKISEGLENQKTPEGAERGDTSNALDRMLSGAEAAKALVEQQEARLRLHPPPTRTSPTRRRGRSMS